MPSKPFVSLTSLYAPGQGNLRKPRLAATKKLPKPKGIKIIAAIKPKTVKLSKFVGM